ncbi:uncharacterized protein (TIGR02600 family) [Prosthecobacter fusiformis]|uniref:Uncharacterized protein (TIGR02600 family) n=1 Tax=Prosthecobacter fusiformis TaxID=48464 RepID=A0A4R7RR60_9BACT|nr:Verru_Chthon cassette protein A [Prosthecobacter fusiformis]TDU67196.1 uncharacterized protein (TIGR02600 family) [Prosthecobacter fusiformis]
MKTAPPRRGVALVMVIAFLALITGLIIAFLTTVSTETQVAKRTDAGTRGRELIDTVNALVTSQIRDATSQGQEIAWASQPGMIRTYGTTEGNAASSPLRYYKLYSAKNLVWNVADGAFNPADDVLPGWGDNDALYTDLNRPVTTLNGQLRYPIFQPPPVAAPGSPATQSPAGLAVNTPPSASAGGTPPADANPAPMPVRWLYVLRDGRLTSPAQSVPGADGQGDKVVWEAGAADAPSETNPIVGRVAYWTDDETSKININTAAGDHWTSTSDMDAGSYWDLPRVTTQFDRQALADFQPAQREYQRYPGHPAATYLSAAFPSLTRGDITQISSRIGLGGSLGGTTLALEPVPLDADRLYAYEDELIFNNERESSVITPDQLEQARFLVTAHSRAPEVNLFNQPRIAAWPVSQNTASTHRSPFDQLIAFCSQVGGKNYIFDRINADSATDDFAGRNVELYTYLQSLTSRPIPGYGGNFSTKYGTDRDQILTEMFDYIRSTNLFDDTIEPQPLVYPTSGNQFTNGRSSKTGALPGHGQVTPIRINDTKGFGRFFTLTEVGMHFITTADFNVPDSNVVPADNIGQTETKPTNRTLGSGTSAVKLTSNQRRIEALLLLEAFSPSQGWGSLRPDMQIRIRGLQNLTVNGTSLGFPSEGVLRIESNGGYHSRMWGGNAGFRFMLNSRRLPARGVMPADSGHSANNSYPFVSMPITISVPNGDASTMQFNGGEITIEIFSDSNPTSGQVDPVAGQTPVQTLTVRLAAGTFPVPRLVMSTTAANATTTDTQSVDTKREFWWSFSRDGALAGFQTFTGTTAVPAAVAGRIHRAQADPGTRTTTRSGSVIHYNSAAPSDVIRTMVVGHGDHRLLAAQTNPPADIFIKHRYYDNTSQFNANNLQEGGGSNYTPGADNQAGSFVTGAAYNGAKRPDIPVAALSLAEATGDWDTGVATVMDGAYINKPDEGNSYRENSGVPYFDANQAHETTGPTFFSPNRQIPSPVMFGSLPNRVKAGVPWSTLLFRPDATSGVHIGAQAPLDHLLLDLFWMPVVEPYAISEPLSTAGKINMNHQIVPFTYIERTTGLRALLRSERVFAVPTTAANVYKSSTTTTNYRYLINADETLKQFTQRFDAGDIFRSASEICELYLVPEQTTLDNMPAFWQAHKLTADNAREHPYATLYPRLTTKSNTYRVHYRVQALQQASRSRGSDAAAWATWEEGKDLVIAENRGSSILERYVDPADPALPDFATTPTATLDAYYRFRVLGSTKFGPK